MFKFCLLLALWFPLSIKYKISYCGYLKWFLAHVLFEHPSVQTRTHSYLCSCVPWVLSELLKEARPRSHHPLLVLAFHCTTHHNLRFIFDLKNVSVKIHTVFPCFITIRGLEDDSWQTYKKMIHSRHCEIIAQNGYKFRIGFVANLGARCRHRSFISSKPDHR